MIKPAFVGLSIGVLASSNAFAEGKTRGSGVPTKDRTAAPTDACEHAARILSVDVEHLFVK
jgi:hypothetical protein